MSKKQEMEKLQKLLAEYDQLIKLAKCEKMYQLPYLEEQSFQLIEEAISFLEAGREVYDSWKGIRNMQSEARWQWYANDPETFTGFREVLLHTEAVKVARKYFYTKNRPALFKTKRRVNKTGDQQ